MLTSHLNKILSLVNEAGRIQGRTKFQKIVYILKIKGANFNERFSYHYYGPYSSDLQLEIEELVDRQILNQQNFNPSSYKVGNGVKVDIDDDILKYRSLISFLVDKDYKLLELASTIYYLEQNGIKDYSKLRNKLNTLKPNLKYLIDNSFQLKNEIETKFPH